MDNRIYVDNSTANTPSPFEHLDKCTAKFAMAIIGVRCAICEEYTSMDANDYKAHGVFICDKCKAAVLHIRKFLEVGGSVV